MIRIDPYRYSTKRCVEIDVVDGDTIKCYVEIEPHILLKQTLRLSGIDTPEISTVHGKQLKLVIQKILDTEPVYATGLGKECYGRTLALIHLNDGSILNTKLVEWECALVGNKRISRTINEIVKEQTAIQKLYNLYVT